MINSKTLYTHMRYNAENRICVACFGNAEETAQTRYAALPKPLTKEDLDLFQKAYKKLNHKASLDNLIEFLKLQEGLPNTYKTGN